MESVIKMLEIKRNQLIQELKVAQGPKDWQEVKLTNEDEEVWLYEGDWVIKSKK